MLGLLLQVWITGLKADCLGTDGHWRTNSSMFYKLYGQNRDGYIIHTLYNYYIDVELFAIIIFKNRENIGCFPGVRKGTRGVRNWKGTRGEEQIKYVC